jgi:tetratricopeptide (TPR) repeat protein
MIGLKKKFDSLMKIIFEGGDLKEGYKILGELKKINRKEVSKKEIYDFCVDLAERCVMDGMFKEAIKCWKIIYRITSCREEKIRALDELGFCYSQIDKDTLSKKCYRKILKLANKEDEYFIEALYQIGEFYSFKSKFKKAASYYWEVIHSLSSTALKGIKFNLIYQKALLGLFICHYKIKKYKEALNFFDECLKCNPKDNVYRDRIYGSRGHMHYEREEYKEAIKWYKKAIEACEQLETPTEKIKQINEKQKEYWEWWLKECEKRLKEAHP